MKKEEESISEFVDHLFRHQSGKLVSVLTKILGVSNIDLAEDVVQDAMAEAIRQWMYKGIPENPEGWLFSVAKYKAINILKHEKLKQKYSAEVSFQLQSEKTTEQGFDALFSGRDLVDDQLRMMFVCCHPSISEDSQIALTLKTLCGFSIPEIAKAFLTIEENINKRLVRARQIIRDQKLSFEIPAGKEFETRYPVVLETIYLLFSEGYNASEGAEMIRLELCEEAIRLAKLLSDYPGLQDKSQVWALLSLMLFNSSRFRSRQNENDKIADLSMQDRTLWERDMIRSGLYYLEKSVTGATVSKYQVLAAIAGHHCTAVDFHSTDWVSILMLYDNLCIIDNSPLIKLNRAVALSKVQGPQKAIKELEKIANHPVILVYPYFYSAMGDFYFGMNKKKAALKWFEKALQFAHNQKEIRYLNVLINNCK